VENEVRKNFNSGRLNICRSKMKPCIMWQKTSAVAEIGKQVHSIEIWNLKKVSNSKLQLCPVVEKVSV
jgi:hypothetical protein